MAHSYLDSVHLQPLTFALNALEKLSSVELALVQFHLDNDEPGFGQTLTNARRIWEERRRQALDRGELLEGQQSRPPSSLSSNGLAARLGPAATPPPVPPEFAPLVETLRKCQQKPGARVMAASLGSTMRSAFPGVLSARSAFTSFREYVAAAINAGLVETGRGEKQGQDWVRLLPPYSQTAKQQKPSLPARPTTAPTMSEMSAPSPLPPDLFHLASLAFPLSPNDLASLPSHQLILLQFRKDPIALSLNFRDVERVFWRRRAEAKVRGEQWQSPNGAKPVSPLASPSAIVSASGPPLEDRLPDRVASSFVNVDLTGLPPHLLDSIPGLIALLPPRIPCIAAGSFECATSSDSARACLAFRTEALASEAVAHIASLPPQAAGSKVIASRSSDQPDWRWRDVVAHEREPLWREYRLLLDLVQGKKRRESSAHPASDGREKRRKSEDDKMRRVQVVRASDRVPLDRLDSLFPLEISMDKVAKDLTNRAAVDDCFVWRFGAVGWQLLVRKPAASIHLLFQSSDDRDAVERWLEDDALRYWRFNGIVARVPLIGAVQQLDWRFRHFSHAWRSDNRFVLDRSDVAPTVGEHGSGGADNQLGNRDTGLFDFELGGHPPSSNRFVWPRDRSISHEIPPPPKRDEISRTPKRESTSLETTTPHLAPQVDEQPRFAPSAAWSATRSSPAAPPQASKLDKPQQTSAVSSAPPEPAASSSLPFTAPTSTSLPFPSPSTTPLDPVEPPRDSPSDSLQLSDLPAFSSALSAARLSPSLTLDRSARPRRPTATDLNDFAMDVDDLFAVAARDHFVSDRVKSEPVEDTEMSLQADMRPDAPLDTAVETLVRQASADKPEAAPSLHPPDTPRPSSTASPAGLPDASAAEQVGAQPEQLAPTSGTLSSSTIPTERPSAPPTAGTDATSDALATSSGKKEPASLPVDERARTSRLPEKPQWEGLPFSLPPSSISPSTASALLAPPSSAPAPPSASLRLPTRPAPPTAPTHPLPAQIGSSAMSAATTSARAQSAIRIPTGPRAMMGAGAGAARPPGLPAKPAFAPVLPPQERL